MNQETFEEAVKINTQIKSVENEISVLKAQEPTTIRFGGNFNLSIPISISGNHFNKIISQAIEEKEHQLRQLMSLFQKL